MWRNQEVRSSKPLTKGETMSVKITIEPIQSAKKNVSFKQGSYYRCLKYKEGSSEYAQIYLCAGWFGSGYYLINTEKGTHYDKQDTLEKLSQSSGNFEEIKVKEIKFILE